MLTLLLRIKSYHYNWTIDSKFLKKTSAKTIRGAQVEQVRAPPYDLLDGDDVLPRLVKLQGHHVGGEDVVLLTAEKLELLLI